jgi:REP element-mobilizing transposase RayT
VIRSIKEVKLFADYKDKGKYLCIMKEYQKKNLFKVHTYCLMDNHTHFEIYADGADISKIMHGINFIYARYYNIRHKRYGHLFQDRFTMKTPHHRESHISA